MSEAFYRLLFSSRTKVLGRKLPPLSLWHMALLEGIDSPFISDAPGGRIELADVQAATAICQVRWPNLPRLTPSLRDVVQAWRYRGSTRFIRKHTEALKAHIRLHLTPPDVMWDQAFDSNREITAPHILTRVVGLVSMGIDYQRIWNDISPGMSLWLLNASAERAGASLRFVRKEDLAVEPTKAPQTEKELRALMKADGCFDSAYIERFVKGWKERRKRG